MRKKIEKRLDELTDKYNEMDKGENKEFDNATMIWIEIQKLYAKLEVLDALSEKQVKPIDITKMRFYKTGKEAFEREMKAKDFSKAIDKSGLRGYQFPKEKTKTIKINNVKTKVIVPKGLDLPDEINSQNTENKFLND